MEIINGISQAIFKNIDRDDINENNQNLLSSGLIDSIDIMALVSEIEKYYQKPLDSKFIETDNFESMENIKNMISKAMK